MRDAMGDSRTIFRCCVLMGVRIGVSRRPPDTGRLARLLHPVTAWAAMAIGAATRVHAAAMVVTLPEPPLNFMRRLRNPRTGHRR